MNRPFAFFIEKAGRLKALSQLFECELKGTYAAGFETPNDELKIAARGVDRNLRFGDDLKTVLQVEAEATRVATKKRAAHLAIFILEGEVGVPRPSLVKVADLARDEHLPDLLIQESLEARDQLSDPENRSLAFGRAVRSARAQSGSTAAAILASASASVAGFPSPLSRRRSSK